MYPRPYSSSAVGDLLANVCEHMTDYKDKQGRISQVCVSVVDAQYLCVRNLFESLQLVLTPIIVQ